MTPPNREARAHHFVPQCWLAGFTDDGQKDGKLYCFDLKRNKQWHCRPSEVGHRRDFNRVEDPALPDPLAFEKLFSKIESTFCAVSRTLDAEKRGPSNGHELGVLIEYMTIQATRTPAFRKVVARAVESEMSSWLESPQTWEAALRMNEIQPSAEGADYQTAKKLEASGQVRFKGPTEFYLRSSALVAEQIDASLKRRHWCALVSQKGEFIGSDNPVTLNGATDRPIGFENAEIIMFPVSRHVLIYGTSESAPTVPLTTELIAQQNTLAMLIADEQVYSHRPDFHMVDSAGKCKNDWTLFSKDDYR